MSDLDPELVQRVAAETNEVMDRIAAMAPDPEAREWLVDVPVCDLDGVKIERFEITEASAHLEKLRAAFNPQRSDRSTDPGTYTRLEVDGMLWMTDTPAEIRDLEDADAAFIYADSALIVGLGLGVLLNRAIAWHEHLKHIDVVERDPRIVAAVGPHYENLAIVHGVELTIHTADIHEWKPKRGSYWDVGFFDIWASINDDDMAEVTRLRSRFFRRLGWFGAWAQDERVAMRRRIKQGYAY